MEQLATGRLGRSVVVALAGAIFALSALPSLAAQATERGFAALSGIAVGANPSVLALRGGLDYTHPLMSQRTGILWDSARVEVGPRILASPSFADLGLRMYVEPVALFDVTLSAGLRLMTDALGFGQAAVEGYGLRGPSATGSSYDGSSARGWFAGVAPRLKGAFGPILVTASVGATYHAGETPATGFSEEPVSLQIIDNEDWVFLAASQVLYRFDSARLSFVALGLDYQRTWVTTANGGRAGTRVAAAAVGVVPLATRWELQAAAFAGGYPRGFPVPRDRLFVLTAVTTRLRL
jgi:hypothetical protein